MPVTPLSIVRDWIERINQGDLIGLVELMSDDHKFYVEGERPTQGRVAMEKAWRAYFAMYPDYRIYEDEQYERGEYVFIIGHTSGSHVPREQEGIRSSVIWKARVCDGRISEWIICPATPENRKRFGLQR